MPGAESYTPLQNAKALYFTARGSVSRRLDEVPPPDVPSGEELASIAEHAKDLERSAARLRHHLPERADVNLKRSVEAVQREGARYLIVWPDGELAGGPQSYYTQRPAMLRRWEQITQILPSLRVYDIRLGKFILGAVEGEN